MPLPQPDKNEEYNEFIERCMSTKRMVKEYPDNRQRRAICEKQWEGGEMKNKPERVLKAIYNQPWIISEDWFETIANIAERQNEETLLTKKGELRQETPSVEYRENGVAILSIIGPIFRYASLFTEISGATSIQKISKDFQSLIDDPSVKSIILNVDSPGGQVHGINEFSEFVYQSKDKKPIYGYTGGNAASAGYWIISSTEEVWADPTSWLGSIGVVIGMKNHESDDIEIVSTSSPKKRVDPNTKDGRDEILKRVDALAEIFIRTVARNRNVEESVVLSDFGQGAVFTGEKAVSLNMADKIGSLEGLISFLQNKQEEKIMSEDINALQKKVDDYEAKLKENQEKLESAQSTIMELHKTTIKQDLIGKIGETDAEFVMKFSDKLETADITALADKFKSYQEMVNKLGESKGSGETPPPKDVEPSIEEVKKYAEEQGISFLDANKILAEKKNK